MDAFVLQPLCCSSFVYIVACSKAWLGQLGFAGEGPPVQVRCDEYAE